MNKTLNKISRYLLTRNINLIEGENKNYYKFTFESNDIHIYNTEDKIRFTCFYKVNIKNEKELLTVLKLINEINRKTEFVKLTLINKDIISAETSEKEEIITNHYKTIINDFLEDISLIESLYIK